MESPEAINLLGDLSDAEKIAFRKWLVLSDMIKRRPIVTVEMWLLGLLTTMRQHLLLRDNNSFCYETESFRRRGRGAAALPLLRFHVRNVDWRTHCDNNAWPAAHDHHRMPYLLTHVPSDVNKETALIAIEIATQTFWYLSSR
jgi:hypothetical protein